MKSRDGVFGGLLRRPWVRVVAAMCLLTTTGCVTTEWAPLPRPVVPRPQMLLMAPVEDPAHPGRWQWEEMVLASPVLEWDSILVGPAVKGGRVAWRGNDYFAVGRARVDQALVGEQRFSVVRTMGLVLGIALPLLTWGFTQAWKDWEILSEPPIIF
jgi:hypothetical protein